MHRQSDYSSLTIKTGLLELFADVLIYPNISQVYLGYFFLKQINSLWVILCQNLIDSEMFDCNHNFFFQCLTEFFPVISSISMKNNLDTIKWFQIFPLNNNSIK